MLPKQHRLAAERDFSRIFKKGKTVHGNALSIRFARNNRPETRVAFVVSTKVSKRAVVRNRLKRQLREISRSRIADLLPGWDVVVMTKAQTVGLALPELRRSFFELLQKARLLKTI